MARQLRCWCGSIELAAFGGGYLACASCDSLVRVEPPAGELGRVRDDGRDFYGRSYWRAHQRALGLPEIEARAADDLGERCLHWLRTVLAVRPPRGRSLELGAAHGGFVAMLGWAGFDAIGLELSPWVSDLARQTFAVPMLTGPIEDQTLEPGFDLIVAMDVLEHLVDPVSTLTRAAELLTAEGVLLLQTPCRPVGKSFETLRSEQHPFLEMMIPEHLFLLGTGAAEQLCRRVDLPIVRFEPAFFPQHDMCLLAARQPLARRPGAAMRADLAAWPAARLLAAMLDLDDRRAAVAGAGQAAARDLEAVRGDQREKGSLIEKLTAEIAELRGDQGEKTSLIEELTAELAAVRGDQGEKASLIEDLTAELAAVRGDQGEKASLIEDLTAEIVELRGDQGEKASLIAELTAEIAALRGDQFEKASLIEDLTAEIVELRGDQRAKARLIDGLTEDLEAARGDQAAKDALIRGTALEIEALRADQAAKELLIRRISDELAAVRADQAAKEALIQRLAVRGETEP